MPAELTKSKFVRRLSSVRPSVRVAFISEPNAWISFKFWLLLPLSYTLGRFLNFWKKCVGVRKIWFFFTNIFSFSLTWDLWEPRFQNATPPTNHSQKFSKLSWIFFPMVLTKPRIEILFFFYLSLNMGAKILKRYSSLKSLLNPFTLFLIFFSVVLTKVLFWIFENLRFPFLTIF